VGTAATRRARRVAAALAVLAGVLGGCATRGAPPTPALSPETLSLARARELTRRWAAEWAAFPGLRAAIDLTVRTARNNNRAAGVLLLSPSALRVEIVTPFGLPAAIGTAGPDGITVYRALEGTAQTGPPTSEAAARWLGIPLDPPRLIQLLVGQVPLPADPTAVTVESSPTPHLAWTRDGLRHRTWVGPTDQPARLVIGDAGRPRLVGEFERGANGELARVRLEAPERQGELRLRYVSAEIVPLPPEAFELKLPPGVPVRPLN